MKKTYLKTFTTILILILTLLYCLQFTSLYNKTNSNSNYLTVYFIDVGQGDCILVNVNGYNLLIDSGPSSARKSLLGYLDKLSISKFDYVIATHPHEDHIGGMDEVLENFDVKSFYAPKVAHTTKTYENMLKAVKNEGLKIQQIKEGTKIDLGKDTEVQVYSPVKSQYEELNNYSPVMKISYGQNSFMFTGDAESLVEKEILNENKDLKADVLKLGHHGSHSSTSEEFLKAVNPSIAVVSCAKDNKYGHPHKETMSNLKKAGITVYETFRDGDITISSNGKKLDVKLHSENK